MFHDTLLLPPEGRHAQGAAAVTVAFTNISCVCCEHDYWSFIAKFHSQNDLAVVFFIPMGFVDYLLL